MKNEQSKSSIPLTTGCCFFCRELILQGELSCPDGMDFRCIENREG